jgi:hypothetical protein
MPARKPPSDNRVVLRLSPQWRQRVAREAQKNNCTLNREMARRIEQSFSVDGLRSIEAVADELTKAWERVRKGGGTRA